MNKSDNEIQKVNTAIKRMLFYSDEEWNAIQNPDCMNEQLFNQCISTSIRINDYDIYMKLSESFPEYSDAMFAQLETCLSKLDPDLPEISQTDMDAKLEELHHAIRKLNKNLFKSE